MCEHLKELPLIQIESSVLNFHKNGRKTISGRLHVPSM